MIDPIYKSKDGRQLTKKQLVESGYSEDRIREGITKGLLTQVGDTDIKSQQYKTKDGREFTGEELLKSGYDEERINSGIQKGALTAIQIKKKDSTGEESIQPSKASSPSQYPLPSKSEKENRDKFIANADAITLIQEHENKSKKTTYDALVGNPLGNMRDYYNYSQSREGKVGKILSDVNSGKISVEDVNYLAQVAPHATRQVIKSVLPQKDNNKLLEPETINEFATEGAAILDKQATDQKVLSNSRNNDFVKQKVASYGIDPLKLKDFDYSEKVADNILSKYNEELKILQTQYPLKKKLKTANRFSVYEDVRENEKEFNSKRNDLDRKYASIRNEIGTSAAYDYAKQNPTARPIDVGEQWYKQADPDGYKLWEKAGKKGPIDADLAQVGINALYGTGNSIGIERAKYHETILDDLYPDKIIAETYHRIGAELYKDENWLFNTAPGVNKLDEVVKQLPEKNRRAYQKHIRERERKMIGTDVPMSGALNKFGEAAVNTFIEMGKSVGDFFGARTEDDQRIDAINEAYDTRFQDVGTYAPGVSRLKEIKQKQKEGKPLSPQEIEEKQDLETFIGVRSTGQEIVDGSANIAGQVVVQALAQRFVAPIVGAGVKAIGLAKTVPVVSGLATEETIAANALDFGISKAAINNITASGIAFASSYDAAKRDALRLMPDDKDAGKRTLYATIVGGLNAATERIFKDEKVLDAFNREVSPSIKSLVSKLSSGKIEREALGSAISDVLGKSKTFLKEAGESNLKESVEELATSAGTSVATAILAPAKFNAQQAFDDAVSTFTTTFLHGGLVAGMAGIHGYRANHLGTPLLAQIGVNERLTNDTKNFINGQILSGAMSQEEANAKFKVLNTAEKINRDVMPQVDKISRLPQKAREKYSIQLLNEKVLANNAESIEDPVLKSAVEAKIKESQDIRNGILKKDLFVDDNYSVKNLEEINAIESREITEREALAIDAIQKMDLSTTGLSAYAEVINDVKASPEEKKAALKGIYDQLTAEGTEAEVGQILGKDADLIYDLNYEKPQESEALSQTTKMPARNDDFVSNRDFFTEQEENEYYGLIEQGKEEEAKDMVLKRRQDVLTGAYKAAPTNKKEVKVIDEGEEIIPQPEEDTITVEELLDKPVIRNGQRGTLIRDGQSVVFKPEKGNREYELGNVDEIKKSSISDYGIEAEESVVTTDDTGRFIVRGNKYINPFEERGQSPTDAILYDKEGNVINVRMKTEDGKRRTFTGNVAEDLAYQITLKEINKNNETRERFESFINEDESARKEMADAGLSETTPEKTVEPDEKIQREKITPKEEDVINKEDARLSVEEPRVEEVGKVEDSNISQPNEAADALEGSYDRLARQMVSEGKDPLTDPEMKALAEQVKKLREGKPKEETKKLTQREKMVNDLANELRTLLGEKGLPLSLSFNYEPLTGNASPLTAISFEDMGIVEGDTIEQAVDKAIEYGGPFTEVFRAIKADPNFKNIQLEILPSKGGNTSEGLYHPTGEGAITPYKLQIYDQGNTQYVLAHELMHFFTLDSAAAQKVKDSKSSKALEGFYNYIVANKGKPVTGLATIENYGLTNFKEFMAELLINPTFRNAISDIYANNYEQIAKTDKFIRDQKGGSIIDIIRDLFRDLINAVIGNKSNVDFNPSESVVNQAAKLMTDLFFGGQDVTSSQTPGQTGAIVGRVADGEGPLAIGDISREDIISDFVKKKIAEGIDEGIIRESLEVSGISPEESLKFIENAKPVEKRSFASEKEKERAVIAEVLSRNISAKEYPTIFENNKTQEQLAAKTQGEGQNREVNGAYVEALQDDLKQVSLESARTLRDALGEDWGIKTLEYMEQNPAIGNLGQVIGLLNIISTEVYQDIRSTHDTDKLNSLKLIQNRIDIVSNQRAREASLGLRQRILYTKFANGEDMKDALANTILSPEQESLLSDLNEILVEPVTDEQLNKVAKPKVTRNAKPKSSTGIFGKAKRKASKSVKSELINQGVNAAKKVDEETGAIINKTFQDYIREANEKIKNIKC